ncbi:ABC transporter ATP-binding protein [Saccharopolyspora sp. NPDC050389]|uniref:ABC transporter ATP-binding protein n=1 Tax=Saccharopolyspora sp. NPDC050389 TaxID=3155516 RepID=UPI00340B867B
MISIEGLTIRYGTHKVIRDVDLTMKPGEFLTLLGPSGCGKSTLLRAVAGFVAASQGRIVIDGRDVTRLDPEHRGIGFVFQNYALFPHMTVWKNVAFGLRSRGVNKSETAERVEEALAMTGLSAHASSRPAQLSGGQQQRTAIARVLVTRPSVLLMDEPLSNLDATLRVRLRADIQRLHEDLNITTMYVTHDQQEALALSDRVGVLREGRIDQLDRPRDLYHNPANSYVCQFVGSANVLDTDTALRFGLRRPDAGDRQVHVRPECIRLTEHPVTEHASPGVVTDVTFLGLLTEYAVDVGGARITSLVGSHADGRWRPGETVSCGFDGSNAMWLSAGGAN